MYSSILYNFHRRDLEYRNIFGQIILIDRYNPVISCIMCIYMTIWWSILLLSYRISWMTYLLKVLFIFKNYVIIETSFYWKNIFSITLCIFSNIFLPSSNLFPEAKYLKIESIKSLLFSPESDYRSANVRLYICHRNPSGSQNCSYQPSTLSIIKPIDLWSSFATFKPSACFLRKVNLFKSRKNIFPKTRENKSWKRSVMLESWFDQVVLFISVFLIGSFFFVGLQFLKMFIHSKPSGRRLVRFYKNIWKWLL